MSSWILRVYGELTGFLTLWPAADHNFTMVFDPNQIFLYLGPKDLEVYRYG